MDLIFAPTTSVEKIDYLKHLIREHHSAFVELYPNHSVTPKMHYNIHIPDWMMR